MKNINSFYITNKNVFTWISVCTMFASICIRLFCILNNDILIFNNHLWQLCILPIFSCIVFFYIVFVNGKDRFYRTTLPIILFAVYFCFRLYSSNLSFPLLIGVNIFGLITVILFISIVSAKFSLKTIMLILLVITIGGMIYVDKIYLHNTGILQTMPIVTDILIILSFIVLLFAMRVNGNNNYTLRFGDRSDGRRLRTIDPMQIAQNYIMPDRVGSSNLIYDKIDMTYIDHYIKQKREEGYAGFGITHIILAAYVNCCAKYPALNRFVAGQRVYSRDDDIQFSMVIKTKTAVDAPSSVMKLHLTPTDTVIDVYNKMSDGIKKIKNAELNSNFDKTAKALSLIPGVLFKFTIWFLRFIDYFGFLPKFLLEVSPFHSSVFFTSMGSLGIPPIVHHLYDFGNMPVFISFGCKYKQNEIDDDGNVVQKKFVEYTVNCDERICDGFYYAAVLKHLRILFKHPELLDKSPEVINHDVE